MSQLSTRPETIASDATHDDVIQAIEDLDRGVQHAFGPSLDYDLIHNGKKYPPKAVFGLAARRLVGRALTPADFSGGVASHCHRTLTRLGFKIERRNGAAHAPRVWAISLGAEGAYFRQLYDEGIIGIGWRSLGDLSKYPSKEAIADALAAGRESDVNPSNNALTAFAFAHVMREGDFVVAKVGRSRTLGLARVVSPYLHEPERSPYHSIRRVEWLSDKSLELPPEAHVPMKTLTDCSPGKHPEFVRVVSAAYGVDLGVAAPGASTSGGAIEALRKIWQSFEASPMHRFRIAVRQRRAAELRERLRDPKQ